MKQKLQIFYEDKVVPVLLKLQTWFILNYLLVVGLTIVGLLIWYVTWFLITKCESEVINAHEIRFYICLFFISIAILTFATLRLYNAIVINTSVSNKVVKSNTQLDKSIQDLNRDTKQASQQDRSIISTTSTKFNIATGQMITALNNLANVFKNNK